MRPIIGITTDRSQNRHKQALTELNEAYSRAVTQAGGVPVLIPAPLDADGMLALFQRLDGILFSGGGDVEPRHYHTDWAGALVGVHPERDALELGLLRLAVERRKPFLGICRGCQLVNVGLGGTLYPDLATHPGTSIQHNLPGSERGTLVHDVAVEAGTRLETLLGRQQVSVNSHHHQGLDRIAADLRISGTAPDGLVEAVEIPQHPFGLAVQWHPEWLTDQPSVRNLFRGFVDAAGR